jgi:nitronate monooxygenase
LRNRFVLEMADDEALDFPLQAGVVAPLWQMPGDEARAAFMPFWAGQAAGLIRELSAGQFVEKLVGEALPLLPRTA